MSKVEHRKIREINSSSNFGSERRPDACDVNEQHSKAHEDGCKVHASSGLSQARHVRMAGVYEGPLLLPRTVCLCSDLQAPPMRDPLGAVATANVGGPRG